MAASRASQFERLQSFCALVAKWNAATSLVSRNDLGRLQTRHVNDSLSLLPYVKGERLVDVGSGGGWPGIPIAISRPDLEVVLLDRSEKKGRFLRHAKLELELDNVTVVVEDATRYRPSPLFDTVTARALAKSARAWDIVRPLLRCGGVVLYQSTTSLAGVEFEGALTCVSHKVTVEGVQRDSWITEISRR